MANCWQNKVKTVTLPCEFGTGFFPHLDKGPLIKILQVWMQLSGRALAQYALGPGMRLMTKNKQQTHKQANQFVNNFAKDLPKPYQRIMSENSDSFQFNTSKLIHLSVVHNKM